LRIEIVLGGLSSEALDVQINVRAAIVRHDKTEAAIRAKESDMATKHLLCVVVGWRCHASEAVSKGVEWLGSNVIPGGC
jgi:hypothetical protein